MPINTLIFLEYDQKQTFLNVVPLLLHLFQLKAVHGRNGLIVRLNKVFNKRQFTMLDRTVLCASAITLISNVALCAGSSQLGNALLASAVCKDFGYNKSILKRIKANASAYLKLCYSCIGFSSLSIDIFASIKTF